MNIFVTNPDPHVSAKVLPDKHVVKMPLETCQMLSIVFSHWYYDWGDDLVKKKDGTPYSVKKGCSGIILALNDPASIYNTAWLIQHGCALSDEYNHRYGKVHGCANSLFEAKKTFHKFAGEVITCYCMVESFTRAMPDEFKYNTSIDTFYCLQKLHWQKPWTASNYLRDPSKTRLIFDSLIIDNWVTRRRN